SKTENGHNSTDIHQHRVVGVHVQFLRVHHTQCSIGVFDVIQVLHSSVQSVHHGPSVLGHGGVTHDGSGCGQVAEGAEVPLSPRRHDQKSKNKYNRLPLQSYFTVNTDCIAPMVNTAISYYAISSK
uniref:Uncharacterized protein n=1 Tax=Hucho hucho TaxID=62062 RepID=A0A4W5PV82_9TELE